MTLDEGRVQANGVDFAYLAAGPSSGPLALCLHGFPDTAWSYRYLLPALADAGYHAVAPFMRGYAPTAIPPDGRYETAVLAADANALHEALSGGEDAVLIGHDWGAGAVYGALGHQPARWRAAVAMAVPPSGAMAAGFLTYDQLKRSFYIFFFQSPLADMAVPANDLEFIARLWQDWSPGYDGGEDVARVRESLGRTENLAAALGYYRALFGGGDPDLADIRAAAAGTPPKPLLYLHGETDGCVGPELGRAAQGFLTEPSRAVMVEGAGHFLHLEKPDQVNALILDFL